MQNKVEELELDLQLEEQLRQSQEQKLNNNDSKSRNNNVRLHSSTIVNQGLLSRIQLLIQDFPKMTIEMVLRCLILSLLKLNLTNFVISWRTKKVFLLSNFLSNSCSTKSLPSPALRDIFARRTFRQRLSANSIAHSYCFLLYFPFYILGAKQISCIHVSD